jgi:hypothetical protein
VDVFRWDEEGSLLYAGQRPFPAQFDRRSAREDIPAESGFFEKFPDYRFESRRAVVWFENQWQLSVIWGDGTWSSNHVGFGRKLPFIETPSCVEVGVLMPNYDDQEGGLWGDPLAYVDVPEFHRVADLVMHLPYEIDLAPYDGESAEGFCDYLITAGMMR